MKPRTNLNDGFLDSRWAWYGVTRTGVPFPNCFTYATARISEILGEYQPLDEPHRVTGAGELIEKHSREFHYSSVPVPGALMVFGSNQYNEYGHAAVCEEVFDNATVSWSQSNLGGPMFEYVTGNPYTYYPWMAFRGYLVHENLINPKYDDEGDEEEVKPLLINILKKGTTSIKEQIYFDGEKFHKVKIGDEVVALKKIHKAMYGAELKEYSDDESAQYWKRWANLQLREPMDIPQLPDVK